MNNAIKKEQYCERFWRTLHPDIVYEDISKDLFFHYTTMETLWKIIDSDMLFARNVRFSNDSEEYEIGKELVEKEIEETSKHRRKKCALTQNSDCYMICLCKEDNLLSQWREYARGGVSVQFDFSGECIFSIIGREEKKDGKIEEVFYPVYVAPLEVQYVDGNQQEQLDKINRKVDSLYDYFENHEGIPFNDLFNGLIPYIKHIGFREEKEVRLIFQPGKSLSSLAVQYLDSKGVMKPYIKVKNGNLSHEKEKPYIKINRFRETSIRIELMRWAEKKEIKVKHDSRLRWDEVVLNDCEEQERVFNSIKSKIDSLNVNRNGSLKLWCEGHLPIRRITVGPSENREEIKESIEHRIKNVYWLNYVEVGTSNIPYREKKEN